MRMLFCNTFRPCVTVHKGMMACFCRHAVSAGQTAQVLQERRSINCHILFIFHSKLIAGQIYMK
jgi:hypothetical protein